MKISIDGLVISGKSSQLDKRGSDTNSNFLSKFPLNFPGMHFIPGKHLSKKESLRKIQQSSSTDELLREGEVENHSVWFPTPFMLRC